MLRPFLLEAKRVGFDVVEVSDNCVELTPRQRRAQIRLAVECGLAVFGEVGSKDAKNDAGLLVSQAEDCFAAGAELVLVEAAELIVDGKPKMKLINGLRAGLDMSRVLIELPGPWISNITLSVVEDMKKFLVGEFGPDVNIANVMPADIMETEALRVGLGVVGPQGVAKVKEDAMPHSTYFAERMGHAEISPQGEFEAGSFQSFTLTYTAGYFGIDDTGSLKIVHRFASDMGRPQFTDPKGWNYTTVEASNGAVLEVKYDGKMNIRPWDKTLFIRVVRGFLRENDRIIVRFGDMRQGSPAFACRRSTSRRSNFACSSMRGPPITTSNCRCSLTSRWSPDRRYTTRRFCRRCASRANRSGSVSRAKTNGAIRHISSTARSN
jgi:hypothetical protein